MAKQRKQYSAEFKFKIALEAAKGLKTINELASEHSIHPNHASEAGQWKRQLLDAGSTIFGQKMVQQQHDSAQREAELYEQIGRLKMELEWLKKTFSAPL